LLTIEGERGGRRREGGGGEEGKRKMGLAKKQPTRANRLIIR
jgi:hypothetical protein